MAAHDPATKGKIVQRAIRHIVDQGFGAASVSQMRIAAGVSNGSFYLAFGNRDNFFSHLLDGIEASRRPTLAVALSHPAKSARDMLLRILRAHLEWTDKNRTDARLRQILLGGLAGEDPARRAPATAREIELFDAWARPLMNEGTIRPMSAPLLHALILGGADAVVRHSVAEESAAFLDTLAPALAETAWVAIRGEKGKAKDRTLSDLAKREIGKAQTTVPARPQLMLDVFADSCPPNARSRR